MSNDEEVAFDIEREKLEIEREKLKLEKVKIELEREKLKLERFKAWWTGSSIIIPLIVVVITIYFGIWSQREQAKNQFEIQRSQTENQFKLQMQQANTLSELQSQQARSQFEIKAAEIVMNTESPRQAQAKSKALANLFPERLPPNFAASFDPNIYSMPPPKQVSRKLNKGINEPRTPWATGRRWRRRMRRPRR